MGISHWKSCKMRTVKGEFTQLTRRKDVIYVCIMAVCETSCTELLQKSEYILRNAGLCGKIN